MSINRSGVVLKFIMYIPALIGARDPYYKFLNNIQQYQPAISVHEQDTHNNTSCSSPPPVGPASDPPSSLVLA